jgi:hypothetical protein
MYLRGLLRMSLGEGDEAPDAGGVQRPVLLRERDQVRVPRHVVGGWPRAAAAEGVGEVRRDRFADELELVIRLGSNVLHLTPTNWLSRLDRFEDRTYGHACQTPAMTISPV